MLPRKEFFLMCHLQLPVKRGKLYIFAVTTSGEYPFDMVVPSDGGIVSIADIVGGTK